MPKVQFRRGDAYVAGDIMIQIYIDGAKRGSLIGAKPLELELPPNLYTIQARMLGLHRGETIVLPINDDDGDMTVSVSGTRMGMYQTLIGNILFFALMALPGDLVWQRTAGFALIFGICAFEYYRWYRIKPNLLRLSATEGIISESPASSTRLSSPH